MSLQVSYTFLIFIHETFIKRLKRLLQIKSLDLLLDALSSNRSKTKMWFTRNAKNWEVVIIRPLSTLFWFFLLFFSHLPVIIIESLWLVDPFTLSIHYEIRLTIMTLFKLILITFDRTIKSINLSICFLSLRMMNSMIKWSLAWNKFIDWIEITLNSTPIV